MENASLVHLRRLKWHPIGEEELCTVMAFVILVLMFMIRVVVHVVVLLVHHRQLPRKVILSEIVLSSAIIAGCTYFVSDGLRHRSGNGWGWFALVVVLGGEVVSRSQGHSTASELFSPIKFPKRAKKP